MMSNSMSALSEKNYDHSYRESKYGNNSGKSRVETPQYPTNASTTQLNLEYQRNTPTIFLHEPVLDSLIASRQRRQLHPHDEPNNKRATLDPSQPFLRRATHISLENVQHRQVYDKPSPRASQASFVNDSATELRNPPITLFSTIPQVLQAQSLALYHSLPPSQIQVERQSSIRAPISATPSRKTQTVLKPSPNPYIMRGAIPSKFSQVLPSTSRAPVITTTSSNPHDSPHTSPQKRLEKNGRENPYIASKMNSPSSVPRLGRNIVPEKQFRATTPSKTMNMATRSKSPSVEPLFRIKSTPLKEQGDKRETLRSQSPRHNADVDGNRMEKKPLRASELTWKNNLRRDRRDHRDHRNPESKHVYNDVYSSLPSVLTSREDDNIVPPSFFPTTFSVFRQDSADPLFANIEQLAVFDDFLLPTSNGFGTAQDGNNHDIIPTANRILDHAQVQGDPHILNSIQKAAKDGDENEEKKPTEYDSSSNDDEDSVNSDGNNRDKTKNNDRTNVEILSLDGDLNQEVHSPMTSRLFHPERAHHARLREDDSFGINNDDGRGYTRECEESGDVDSFLRMRERVSSFSSRPITQDEKRSRKHYNEEEAKTERTKNDPMLDFVNYFEANTPKGSTQRPISMASLLALDDDINHGNISTNNISENAKTSYPKDDHTTSSFDANNVSTSFVDLSLLPPHVRRFVEKYTKEKKIGNETNRVVNVSALSPRPSLCITDEDDEDGDDKDDEDDLKSLLHREMRPTHRDRFFNLNHMQTNGDNLQDESNMYMPSNLSVSRISSKVGVEPGSRLILDLQPKENKDKEQSENENENVNEYNRKIRLHSSFPEQYAITGVIASRPKDILDSNSPYENTKQRMEQVLLDTALSRSSTGEQDLLDEKKTSMCDKSLAERIELQKIKNRRQREKDTKTRDKFHSLRVQGQSSPWYSGNETKSEKVVNPRKSRDQETYKSKGSFVLKPQQLGVFSESQISSLYDDKTTTSLHASSSDFLSSTSSLDSKSRETPSELIQERKNLMGQYSRYSANFDSGIDSSDEEAVERSDVKIPDNGKSDEDKSESDSDEGDSNDKDSKEEDDSNADNYSRKDDEIHQIERFQKKLGLKREKSSLLSFGTNVSRFRSIFSPIEQILLSDSEDTQPIAFFKNVENTSDAYHNDVDSSTTDIDLDRCLNLKVTKDFVTKDFINQGVEIDCTKPHIRQVQAQAQTPAQSQETKIGGLTPILSTVPNDSRGHSSRNAVYADTDSEDSESDSDFGSKQRSKKGILKKRHRNLKANVLKAEKKLEKRKKAERKRFKKKSSKTSREKLSETNQERQIVIHLHSDGKSASNVYVQIPSFNDSFSIPITSDRVSTISPEQRISRHHPHHSPSLSVRNISPELSRAKIALVRPSLTKSTPTQTDKKTVHDITFNSDRDLLNNSNLRLDALSDLTAYNATTASVLDVDLESSLSDEIEHNSTSSEDLDILLSNRKEMLGTPYRSQTLSQEKLFSTLPVSTQRYSSSSESPSLTSPFTPVKSLAPFTSFTPRSISPVIMSSFVPSVAAMRKIQLEEHEKLQYETKKREIQLCMLRNAKMAMVEKPILRNSPFSVASDRMVAQIKHRDKQKSSYSFSPESVTDSAKIERSSRDSVLDAELKRASGEEKHRKKTKSRKKTAKKDNLNTRDSDRYISRGDSSETLGEGLLWGTPNTEKNHGISGLHHQTPTSPLKMKDVDSYATYASLTEVDPMSKYLSANHPMRFRK